MPRRQYSLFRKLDPYHGAGGKFSFGAGEEKPARPVGNGGKVNEMIGDRASGSDKWTLGGSIAGDLGSDIATRYALAGMGADVGGMFGPEGRLLGGTAGTAAAWAAPKAIPILAGIAGSFLGAKIGNALYELKQRVTGEAVAQSAFDANAGLTGRQTAGEAGSIVGGASTYAAARLTGIEPAISARAGQVIGGLFGHPGIGEAAGETLGAAASSLPGDVLGYRAGAKAYDAAGGKNPKGASRKEVQGARVGRRLLTKAKSVESMFSPMTEQHMNFDGTYNSLTRTAPTFLFGRKAWGKVKGTPFANYLQRKIDDTAETLDEAQQQMSPTPYQIEAQMEQERQAQAQQQMQQQEMQLRMKAAESGGEGGGEKDFGKSLGFSYPNDANASMFSQSEQPATGIKFLRRMQAADVANSRAQIRRLFTGQRVENLQPQPMEDERQYRARVKMLFRQGVDGTPISLYKVHLKVENPTPAVENHPQEEPFSIISEFDKVLNTPGDLDQGLLWGWASIIEKDGKPVVDHDRDWTDESELVKAAHDYITHRTGGVLHDEKGKQIGEVVESVVLTKDLQKALGIDLGKTGWLIAFQVRDERVKALAKRGLLKSFSIGGAGKRTPMEPPDDAVR